MRKQAAVTLRCMQALVRVQARVRARRVRLALESETGPQMLLQQQLADHEARVREIEVMITYYIINFIWPFNFCREDYINVDHVLSSLRKVGVIALVPLNKSKLRY